MQIVIAYSSVVIAYVNLISQKTLFVLEYHMNLIARKSYPALDCILWDTKADKVTEETAFHLYEKRWKFIQQDKLTREEKTLIERLTNIIGHGLFLPA